METYANYETPDEITIEYEDKEAPFAAELAQCNTCKRTFNPKVLVRHSVICENLANKKREPFDSSRKRAEGTDIPTLKPMKPKSESPKKQSNWHKKHEDIMANPRAVRTFALTMKDGGSLPPPPPTYDQDYVQCPYCQRTFNQRAGERHIKFCQEQAARMPRKGKLADEKKPPARTQYKPPAPVRKATSAVAASIPAAFACFPQRAGPGQPTGIPPSKMLSEIFTRTNSTGLTSPPPCIGNKTGAMSSGCRTVRNTRSVTGLDKKKSDSRDDARNESVNGGMKSRFCHGCGSKYPVESANFCCECGIKRIII